MIEVILDRLNRKWVFAVLLFGFGLITPYCLQGFFQALSAQNELSASVAYPENLKKEFARAVSLTDAGNHREAISVYRKMIEQYPHYPEPYNNLAVLYAKTSQLSLAKEMLEKAMKTNPAYAAVYDNLGDVYRSMAAEAYRKALHIDKPTLEDPAKLTMIAALSSQPSGVLATRHVEADPVATMASNSVSRTTPTVNEKPAAPVTTPDIASTTPATPTTSPASASATGRPIQNPSDRPSDRAPSPSSETTKPSDTARVAAKPAPATDQTEEAKPDKVTAADKPAKKDQAPVVAAVKNWASAWSRKDMNAYLAAYDKNFKAPAGQSRSSWESDRRVRIMGKDSIHVSVEIISVSFSGDDKATVHFKQRYNAGSLKTSTRKTMALQQRGSDWKILEERIG